MIHYTIEKIAARLRSLLTAAHPKPVPNAAEEQYESRAGINGFAFGLLARLARRSEAARENVFVSPFSVEQAVLLAANGAAGETQTAFLHALRRDPDIEQVNRRMQTLRQLLTSPSGNEYEWCLANAIWTQHPPGEAFAQRCATFYGADAHRLNGVAPINDWVQRQTRGKIPSIIQSLAPDAALVLTNVVYFKGRWLHPFRESDTEQRARFHSPGDLAGYTLPRMHRTAHAVSFYRGSDFEAVSLPYHGGIEIVFLLPNRSLSAPALAARLTPQIWQSLQDHWRPRYVHVGIPRFALEYEIGLLRDMEALGMPTTGDFSPLEQGEIPIIISAVIHKTFLRVDEAGTEAAAATAILAVGSAPGVPERPYDFIVDRPFLCALVHSGTGIILFFGIINRPDPIPA